MIPKIFHRIWFGSEPFPDYGFAQQEQLKALYPDWEIITYRTAVNSKLTGNGLRTGNFITKCPNVGMQADVFRLEMLWAAGGVYLDLDVTPLEVCPFIDPAFPFMGYGDDLPTCFGAKDNAGCGNWFMAMPPGSRVARTCLDTIAANRKRLQFADHHATFVGTGPGLVSKVFASCSEVTILDRGTINRYFHHESRRSWIPKETQ